VESTSEKGRGQAQKQIWLGSNARVLSYMDADFSADLEAFPQLIEAVSSGSYDVAGGSRLLKSEFTIRCAKRDIVSRCYNEVVRALLGKSTSDMQCGFKALTREPAQQLLPLVVNRNWFFDTELIFLAERCGRRVFDMPVKWAENPDSSVSLWRTSMECLSGVLRLRRNWGGAAGSQSQYQQPQRLRSGKREYRCLKRRGDCE